MNDDVKNKILNKFDPATEEEDIKSINNTFLEYENEIKNLKTKLKQSQEELNNNNSKLNKINEDYKKISDEYRNYIITGINNKNKSNTPTEEEEPETIEGWLDSLLK